MSKNGIGVAVIVIEAILSALGMELPEGSVLRAIEGAIVAASVILLVWNQVGRDDVKGFFFKRW